MPSNQHRNFSVETSVDIYNPVSSRMDRFGVRYFLLSIVNAQLKEVMLSKSLLYERFSKYVEKGDVKSYLDNQNVKYDEEDYGVDIRKSAGSRGHGIALVKSSSKDGSYTTTFPFLKHNDPSHHMLNKSYYCGCDAGRMKPRHVDLLFCEHEARSVIKSHLDSGSWDVGLLDPLMVKNTGMLVKGVNSEKVKLSRSEIYQNNKLRVDESRKIMTQSFSDRVNRKI